VKETQKNKTVKTPITVQVTLWVILGVGIAWLVYSLYLAIGPDPSFAQLGAYRWIMAATTFVPGLICVVLWFLLRKRWKPAWYLSVIALVLMTIVGIFDQVGWVDLIFILATAVPLVLLIIDRKWYLKA
jgi:lysylphosphatidylglycerol synthetase-like protein (DUF2156 family)